MTRPFGGASPDLVASLAVDEVENTNVPLVWVLADPWRIAYANRRARTVLGVAGDESTEQLELPPLSNRDLAGISTTPRPDDLLILAALVVECDGEIQEIAQRLPDLINVQPVQIAGLRGVALADRRFFEVVEVERRLADTQELMQRFLDLTPAEIFVKDLEGRYLLVNSRLAATFGMPADEIVGSLGEDVVNDAEAVARFNKFNAEVVRRRAPVERRETIDFDGERRDFWTVLFPIFDPDGEVAAVGGVASDVTEQSKAERARRASEDRFRVAFESANEGLAILDLDSRILVANERMCDMLGYRQAELVGQSLPDFRHPDEPSDVEDRRRELLKEGQQVFNVMLERADGSPLHVESSVAVLSDEQGRPYQIIAHLSDLTQRRDLEHRTRQAEKLEAIGQLAGGIAHDINNLLGAIMGYAELLALDLEKPADIDRCQQVILQARRAADFTARLLSFARSEPAGRRVFDLHAIVGEVVAIMERSIDPIIEIRVDLAAAVSTVDGDPSQIQGALLNLALNARDAVVDPGTITIATRQCGSDHIVVSVADTGVGLDDEAQQQVFEPFYTTKSEGRGTGLGLTSVVAAAHQHGGEVELDSKPGEGATFSLKLPIGGDAVEPAAFLEASPVSSEATVLVVDDDESMRYITAEMLEREGIRVLEAADGVEGLRMVEKHHDHLDLVLFDMKMPRMSGREMFEAIHRQHPDLPGLLMTGYSADENAIALRRAGVEQVIQKPFTRDDMVERVVSTVKPESGIV